MTEAREETIDDGVDPAAELATDDGADGPRGGMVSIEPARPAFVIRLARAIGVGIVWVVGLVPWVLGAGCPVARLLEVPCPGCGMTRAVRLVLAGHVEAGVRLHPLAFPSLFATVLLAVTSVALTYRDGSPRALVAKPGIGPFVIGVYAAVCGGLVVLWLARAVGLAGGPVPI